MAFDDVNIDLNIRTQQSVNNLDAFSTKWLDLAAKLDIVTLVGRKVFDMLNDVFKAAKEGADSIGGEVAASYDQFDSSIKELTDSGKELLALVLLPIAEGGGVPARLLEINEALDAGEISWLNYLGAASQLISFRGLFDSEYRDGVIEDLDLVDEATGESAAMFETLRLKGLRLGEIAESGFDGAIGAALSNVDAALITTQGHVDNVVSGFRELGLAGPEVELAMINLREAQGLLTAEQADSERLMLALSIAIKDGLEPDLLDLQTALLDGILTQEEFALLLGETGQEASDAGDDMDYLSDRINSIPAYKKFVLDIEVNGAIPDLDFSDPTNKGTTGTGGQPGGTGASSAANVDATGASGLDFLVPPGHENDDYIVGVKSYEHVQVTPAGQTTNMGGVTIIVQGSDDPYATAQAVADILGGRARQGISAGLGLAGM